MNQPSRRTMKLVRDFMARNRGKLYSPIPHPAFAGWPSSHGLERLAIIKPHLPKERGKALDIGTHFGSFSHWLEDFGFEVTAVEHSPKYAAVAREIRDLAGKRFNIIEGSVFDVETGEYQLALALNIFHHFLKSKDSFYGFEAFLRRMKFKTMIFQTHAPEERQMENAYRNMDQGEFVEFVCSYAGFTRAEHIGTDHRRKIFRLDQ